MPKTTTNPIGLDQPEGNFLKDCPGGADPASCLPSTGLRKAYARLARELDAMLESGRAASACQAKGDGNLDQWVNAADLDGWKAFRGKGPSRYDIDLDGATDGADRGIIEANLGTDCMDICERADLDRSGAVDDRDIALARAEFTAGGACDDGLCSGDMDGDGEVAGADLWRVALARKSCAAATAAAAR
jgi:hypothetical protein